MTKSIHAKNIVLYADDDVDDLMIVTEAFAKHTKDVELITAQDGIEALEYLNNLTSLDPLPCLIILDINMSKLNGKETLVKIRELSRFKEMPIVLFSTSSAESDKKFAASYNAGFMTKPIEMLQMEKIIHQFLDHCEEEVKKKVKLN
jgi:CheY-like chemotaxis protein